MAKTVVNPNMVVHLWAAQTQDHARTSSGTISFNAEELFSYQMPIGRIVETGEPPIKVILLNCAATHRSHTTNTHYTSAKSAVSHFVHVYEVPYINPNYGGKHKENLEHLCSVYRVCVAKYMRAIKSNEWEGYGKKTLARLYGAAKGYGFIFKLEEPLLTLEADIAAIDKHFADRAAKQNDPKVIARRKRAEQKREAERAEQARLDALALDEKIQAWKEGAKVKLPWEGFKTPNGGVYLRVKGDELETSMGAVVPLSEAVLVFRVIANVLSNPRLPAPYHVERRCGSFMVNSVYPNGNIKAGCHLIECSESLRIAAQLGLELPSVAPVEAAPAM